MLAPMTVHAMGAKNNRLIAQDPRLAAGVD
jgi:hypothetical protein